MNGPHDLGGKDGLGAVRPEPDEPVFHHPWEGRMYGVAFSTIASGVHSIDAKRHAIEKMPHAEYLDGSYYEHWLYAIERIMDEKGLVSREEIDRRVAEQADEPMPAHPAAPENPSQLARTMLQVLRSGTPHHMPDGRGPALEPGQRVRARNLHPKRHLRLPAYVKGREGVVEDHRGHFGHPEARAHGEEDLGAHLYRVAFKASELWGPDAEHPDDVISLDLIEEYLEPAA